MNNKAWWEEHQNWQSPEIASNNTKQHILSAWVVFLGSIALVTYMLLEQQDELTQHYQQAQYSEMLVLLAATIPLFLLIYALKKTRDRALFGDTHFVMDPFPANMGSNFSGYVDITKNARNKKFTAELLLSKHQNNPRVSDEDRKKPKLVSKLLWKMPVTIRQEAIQGDTPTATRLRLEARLPDDAPSSESPFDQEYHAWELLIFSEDKKFKRTWDVPII